MVTIRFMSLVGKFAPVKTEQFETLEAAKQAVTDYAEEAGFTRVRAAEDNDLDGMRFTATTPNGRAGRNVAYVDFDYDDSDY